MDLPGFERAPQGLALTQYLRLPHNLIDALRAQAIGKRTNVSHRARRYA
jgi:hypothetical protein